ncbi:HGGxSTG domain-containing protein [Paenibacillus sp. GYB003]|uniref:HGGxSTG domain-containing protein n=1 Tax=Paenibacillus sp. GYB003 TaxID=2994392 RepID=UPI002F96C667
MSEQHCGAKTRSNGTCRKKPMRNGRCYMHGGASTGPKNKTKHSESMKGNKNSLRTGEYETIWFDSFSPEDIQHYELTPTSAIEQLDHEIKIADIRERRMMKRIRDSEKSKCKQKAELITKIEDSLSRLQAVKSRLIDQKIRLQEITDPEVGHNSLDQLVSILAQARNLHTRNE